MKLDLLAIGVHPDDVEISACGILLHHIALGQKVGILDLTRGELGTRGTADIRDKEAAAATKIMGAAVRGKLSFADGFFQNDRTHVIELIRVIRYFKPTVVLANAVHDRHPDHGRAAKLVQDACFYAGLEKISTEWQEQPQERHRPRAIYHYIQDYDISPQIVVDITPYMEKKFQVLKAFKSQFYDPDSTEPQTPISGSEFFEVVRSKARLWGRYIGVEYAEALTINRPVGVSNLLQLQ